MTNEVYYNECYKDFFNNNSIYCLLYGGAGSGKSVAITQKLVLRAIQEKTVRPIGHAKEIPVNIRLLSATHKDLAAEVAACVLDLQAVEFRAKNADEVTKALTKVFLTDINVLLNNELFLNFHLI